MITISRLTREYLFWPVESPDDLSTSNADVAFIPNPVDIPQESDWNAAALVTYVKPPGNEPWAVRILVGPGHASATPLSAGDHQAWVRITDDPERPVRKISLIVVE